MKRIQYIVFLFILLMICELQNISAQNTSIDSVSSKKNYTLVSQKAAMLSAVFPGLGQAYNRKYWKLPIVYAGFGGLGYGVTYYGSRYNNYIKAYQDFTDKIPQTNSYIDLVMGADPLTYDPVLHPDTYTPAKEAAVKDQLLLGVDYYRKNRDLLLIGIGFWYVLSILDANVDASLFDYDIDTNLNLSVIPMPVNGGNYFVNVINFNLEINF